MTSVAYDTGNWGYECFFDHALIFSPYEMVYLG